MKLKLILSISLTFTIPFFIISVFSVQPAIGYYYPQITATISKTEVDINENVTITEQIFPIEPKTLRLGCWETCFKVDKLVGVLEI